MRTHTVTDAAEIVAVQSPFSSKGYITLQVESDGEDSVYLKWDGSEDALTPELGIELKPGETITIVAGQDTQGIVGPIEAVCDSEGDATLRIQEVNFQAPPAPEPEV
jgi:hypothetical protein